MGKKKIREKKEGFDTEFSLSTIRVANLPYTFTKSQLEETFSDVGPVRRCFMVTEKGSTDHRGSAIVQFAVTEDAKRAIELKNGSSVGGRKIRIKQAPHRAPLEQRRPNAYQVKSGDSKPTTENDNSDKPKGTPDMPKPAVEPDHTHNKDEDKKVKKDEKVSEAPQAQQDFTNTKKNNKKSDKPKETKDEPKEQNQKKTPKVKKDSKYSADNKSGSEKQRVARTVIYGGLLNADMAEDIHRRAREIGTVSSFTYPLPKDELEHNGLAQEGCKMSAASIVFTSVTSARASVALLHQKEIKGLKLWARQLGGEGAKTQKWKVIVRNLPFQAKANEIRDLFSSAGFVWDVYMPPNPTTGLSKGFAFVKFTCKQDAEKAIKKFNGQMFLKRTITVDWTVPKNIYASVDNPAVATEDGDYSGSDGESLSSDDDMEDDIADTVQMEEDSSDTVKTLPKETLTNEIEKKASEVNFDAEADVARKVLQNLLSSSAKGSVNNDSTLPKKKEEKLDETVHTQKKPSANVSKEMVETAEAGNLNKSKTKNVKPTDGEEDLHNEIFIRNLPFEVDNEEVKQRFSAFGEVLTFIPCLHNVTKRPKGTGFLKFKSADAADAAVAAADVNSDLGIFLKGRQLTVLKTLDKESARKKELEKAKPVDTDFRNLYLAKEGLIPEGSSVADQISASDMSKRKSLQTIKEIKLQSPNWHVSKTCLILYNVPKSMSEKELRKICIDAVTSRATKQNPVIRQIKFLKDKKKSEMGKASAKDHSRGVAFIEFTEHEHAIVALRTLNNNPVTFGSEHRPIVEFALDNVQKLKQRQDQAAFNELNRQRNNIPQTLDGHSNKAENTRKRNADGSSKFNHVGGTENNVPNEASTDNRPIKKQRNKNQFTPKETPEALQKIRERSSRKDKNSITEKSLREPSAQPLKRKLQDRKQQPNIGLSTMENKKAKKKAQPGEDHVDKLDLLIQKYQSKFSQPSSNKTGGDNKQQGSKQLKRWYQT